MSQPKPKLMVIDDLDSARAMMRRTLARGYEVYDFASVAEALPAVERAEFDAIVTDLRMPGIDGLEGLKRFKAKVPDLPVILVTAFATVETAIEAMKAGAFDYLKKPFEPEELELVVARAAEHARLKRDNARLREQLTGASGAHGIVGQSQAIRDVTSILQRIAPSNVPILIEGESGTGKDLLARAAHAMSPRAGRPYVSLNMSAIPENLAEAELFGHEKGAFTGAEQAREGFFAEAEGGTLFLDELGLLPLATPAQAAAGAAGRRVHPGGQPQAAPGGRAHHRRHQRGPGRAGQGRQVPRGPLVPAAGGAGAAPAAARAARGHPAARRAPHPQARRPARPARRSSPTPRPCGRCSTTPGPATSASWSTPSSAACCWPRARPSPWPTCRPS